MVVSTRGMGRLEKRNRINYVKEDFMLSTVDIVQDPSASRAFVNGIMEGVEWIWNNGILEQRQLKQIETEIKNAGRTHRADAEIRAFKNFLSLVKSNMRSHT